MQIDNISDEYEGGIPSGADLCVYCPKCDPAGDDALVLYGFDEWGMMDGLFDCRHAKQHAFISESVSA